MSTEYEPVTAGPIKAGDECKRNQATLWLPVLACHIGYDVRNYYFWQFRRPVSQPKSS